MHVGQMRINDSYVFFKIIKLIQGQYKNDGFDVFSREF